MAWNTSTSYTSASAFDSTVMNGVGSDLRTWGGNVDGGGFNLANVASIYTTGLVGIGTASPHRILEVSSTFCEIGMTDTTLGTNLKSWRVYQSVGIFRIGTVNDAFSSGSDAISITRAGLVGIGTNSPTAPLQVVGVPVYANNAAAIAGGLTAGAFYRTGANPDPLCIVH
jgi:hypothetical protein